MWGNLSQQIDIYLSHIMTLDMQHMYSLSFHTINRLWKSSLMCMKLTRLPTYDWCWNHRNPISIPIRNHPNYEAYKWQADCVLMTKKPYHQRRYKNTRNHHRYIPDTRANCAHTCVKVYKIIILVISTIIFNIKVNAYHDSNS